MYDICYFSLNLSFLLVLLLTNPDALVILPPGCEAVGFRLSYVNSGHQRSSESNTVH